VHAGTPKIGDNETQVALRILAARYVAEADTSAQSGNRLRSQELWNRVSRPGHNASYLASAFPLRWGYFFDERYPYVRIRPPRGARTFENADIFPPAESGTGQTNIFVQLYFSRRHGYLVRRHG
jgi:hypothetical protein